jgi:hypothetical protein
MEVFNMISTVTTTTTTVTTAQVMTFSIIAVIALIAFLAFKEILSAEADKSQRMKSFVNGSNIAIVPLLLVFVAIVAYKVVTII